LKVDERHFEPLVAAIPISNIRHMVTSAKSLRKLSIATAVVALAGGVLGVGAAEAQERPATSSIDQFVQMSSDLFRDRGGSPAPAPDAPVGSDLIRPIPEESNQLQGERLGSALDSTLRVKNNHEITVDFRENGLLSYNDGCNTGTANYQIDNTGALRISDLAETKLACEPGTQKDADDLKLILRSNPQLYQLDSTTLFLSGQGHGIDFEKMHGRAI